MTAGRNQFGGTLRLLGRFGSWSYRWNRYRRISIGFRDWLWTVIGAPCGTAGMASKNPCSTDPYYRTFTTVVWGTPGFYLTTTVGAVGWPWTTGRVTVSEAVGPLPSLLARTGYHNRNSWGSSRIQLVSARLTRWSSGADRNETGSIAIFTIAVPEPASWVMLVAGMGPLAMLARCRRR